jgi:hypothetical protein
MVDMVDMDTKLKDREPLVYRGLDLASNEIHTLVLSGGGYYGLLYLGVIQWLEARDMRKDIKTIVAVSVGSMVGLMFALGYSSQAIFDIVIHELNLPKCLEINADNILNIVDGLGINNGEYIEQTLKALINKSGVNPYITIQGLYEETGIDLQIGFTKCVANKFILASRHNEYRTMPVWLAIRASASIPLILEPVTDYDNNDVLVDGGVISNNPIKYYLESYWHANYRPGSTPNRHRETREIGIQCNIPETTGNSEVESGPDIVIEEPNRPLSLRYRQGFMCFELNTRPQAPVNVHTRTPCMDIDEYLKCIMTKIFTNQESMRHKYNRFVKVFDCVHYEGLNAMGLKNNITAEQLRYIVDDVAGQLDDYLATHLLTMPANLS